MNLRPYQARAVESVSAQLAQRDDTLLVAPTGSGKSLLIAAVAEAERQRLARPINVLVGQHRGELARQNRERFERFNRGWATAAFDADTKRFARPQGFNGAATFAMVPTLCQPKALAQIPAFDLVLLDEAHHAPAPTWVRTIAAAREKNPALKLVGFTATPERGDGKALGSVFGSVAEQIGLGELIESGFLVPPRALAAEAELAGHLRSVSRSCGGRGDFDMTEVAKLIDQEPITNRVIDLWQEAAGSRRTIVFCSTVAHARHVAAAFKARGFSSGVVTGEDEAAQRAGTLRALARGEIQVVVNCMTLTEGFDEQSLGCVVILRPSAFRSLVIQIIGRGLRIVDPAVYPGLPVKRDCLILDFGGSIEALDGLDNLLQLGGAGRKREPGPSPMKPCANMKCRRPIPLSARECPLCGYFYPRRADEPLPSIDPMSIRLRPVEIVLRESPFVWIDLPDPAGRTGRAKIATSEKVWSVVFCDRSGTWHAFGVAPREVETSAGAVVRDSQPRHLASGALDVCLSRGDDFLGEHGDARKHGRQARVYHGLPATQGQLDLAKKLGLDAGPRPLLYPTACRITARLAGKIIRTILPDVQAVAA